ncbi:hypothetical protein [Phaeobacter sp. HF9A]|uniref:hypothetical protein n=1 Tax=Phaeobacter sp. HF9A TaxID=2721561 RepID=UPI00143222C3|nr:hypothetical protein [Phaeobacter sp. HF9A]NIZ12355.1 hypothetical protein [Phaeobacter sp. HF9A]
MPELTASVPRAFRFDRDARSLKALLFVALWLLVLLALLALFQARLWIVALLALPLLPALWELWRNPAAWLEMDDTALRWRSARSEADIALREIDHVVLLTRWDFSIRATVHTKPGTHHRLPPEVTPNHRAFEQALETRAIPVKRQHFNVL